MERRNHREIDEWDEDQDEDEEEATGPPEWFSSTFIGELLGEHHLEENGGAAESDQDEEDEEDKDEDEDEEEVEESDGGNGTTTTFYLDKIVINTEFCDHSDPCQESSWEPRSFRDQKAWCRFLDASGKWE